MTTTPSASTGSWVVALAGASLGFVLNYAASVAVGRDYPIEPTTFVAVAAGAYAALKLSDRFSGGDKRAVIVASVLTVTLVAVAAFLVTR